MYAELERNITATISRALLSSTVYPDPDLDWQCRESYVSYPKQAVQYQISSVAMQQPLH